MTRRPFMLGCLLLLCAASVARAQGVAIDHKEVGCIVVGKYPKMNACFTPAASLARSRVYFRPEGTPSWYYVDMKSDQPCFTGVLPRPGKKLVGKKIEYYVEAQDKTFNPARTAEYGPIVVQSAQECKKDVPVAPFLNNATVAVFPSLPAGFVGGGIGSAAVIGIAAAGAAAAGTAAVVATSNDDTTTTTIVTSLNTTTTVVATTTTTTTTTPPRVNRAPFAVLASSPDPATGQSPLTVTFDLCKSTDPDGDPLSFFFDFGDGSTASGSCLESHTYQASFRGTSEVAARDASYQAAARVVDPGSLSSERNRQIKVGSPPPKCPPPTISLSVKQESDCQTRFTVTATTTDASKVRICADSCQRNLDASLSSQMPTCRTGDPGSDGKFSATFDLDTSCVDVSGDADGCGGAAKAPPRTVFLPCSFRDSVTDAAQPRTGGWSSDLTLEGGRLQVAMNAGTPLLAGHGRAAAHARLVEGENRVEAVLVESAGKPGLWRIELAPSEAILEGSLRVLSGEVVSLGTTSATFRLSGRPGERIVFTFLKK